MLSVRQTKSRNVTTLDGVWKFKVDNANNGIENNWFAKDLENAVPMPVPASYNDVTTDKEIHDHVGIVWYQRNATVPHNLGADRLILRFGSVTHTGRVFVNNTEVASHTGGYLPFEADITDLVAKDSEFRISVAVDNRLSNLTLPPGRLDRDLAGNVVQEYLHDFYNYAGIHRSVVLYTRPANYIEDITIVTDIDGPDGIVKYQVATLGCDSVKVRVLSACGCEVAAAQGESGTLRVPNAKLWAPGAGNLYTLEVSAGADIYPQRFGIRTVAIKDGQFLINGKPFYFRGYGRHEDNLVRGKGHDDVLMVHDFEIMKWQGANSFRTSHYPYDERVMDYADEQGFVVIDETAAVGLNMGIGMGVATGVKGEDSESATFNPHTINDQARSLHAAHIKELIARDKNHPCVVLWSIANEPESHTKPAAQYFEPLAQVAREADPSRPVGYVNVMLHTAEEEQVADFMDVVMLNRYDGWYTETGNLRAAEVALRKAIDGWKTKYPGKPIIFTEYGPDTLAGTRDFMRRPWSEEFQEDMMAMFHRVFDDYPEVVGEQMWNFADFQTKEGIIRVDGNKKGMFTRQRTPKSNAYRVRQRWLAMKEELGF